MLSIKEIVLVVKIILVKPNVMKNLDGINIIIQLSVQNHQNISKTTSIIALEGLSLQMLQKTQKLGKTKRYHVLPCGNLIVTNKRT